MPTAGRRPVSMPKRPEMVDVWQGLKLTDHSSQLAVQFQCNVFHLIYNLLFSFSGKNHEKDPLIHVGPNAKETVVTSSNGGRNGKASISVAKDSAV